MNLNRAFLNWQNFERVVNTSQDAAFIIAADKTVLFANSSVEPLLGYEAQPLIGEPLPELFDMAVFDSLMQLAVETLRKPDSKPVVKNSIETFAFKPDGTDLRIQLTITALATNEALCYYVLVRENLKPGLSEMQLEQISAVDELTGLCNRREFQRMLESHIRHPLSLAIIDIDQYKKISHRYGFVQEEIALKSLAELMKSEFPDAICLARLRLDEFAILYSGGMGSGFYQKCEDFRVKVSQIDMLRFDLNITVSIGVAKYVENSRQLLTKADQALTVAKKSGRNRVHMLLK